MEGPGAADPRRAGAPSSSRSARVAEHETEHEPEEEDQRPEQGGYDGADDLPEDEANEVDVSDLQGIARQELEAPATELEEVEGNLAPDQTAALEEAALQVSQMPEALEVIRGARGQIQGKRGGK